VIDYTAIEVLTMYENNIEARFVGHVERFVNVSWEKKDALATIKASDASSEDKTSRQNALCAATQDQGQSVDTRREADVGRNVPRVDPGATYSRYAST
jgi:hypothetical protein